MHERAERVACPAFAGCRPQEHDTRGECRDVAFLVGVSRRSVKLVEDRLHRGTGVHVADDR